MRPAHRHSASLGRRFARVAVVSACLLAPVCAPQCIAAEVDEPAIPPGQDELLADMLGRGVPLSECEMIGGEANYTTITATYMCREGEVIVELAHRDAGDRSSTPTDRFAITLQNGSPPHGFVDALVSRVRSREAAFEWKWPAREDARATQDGDYGNDGSPRE